MNNYLRTLFVCHAECDELDPVCCASRPTHALMPTDRTAVQKDRSTLKNALAGAGFLAFWIVAAGIDSIVDAVLSLF